MKKYFWFLLILILLFISSGQTYEQQSLIPTLKQWLPGEPLKDLLSTLQISYWGRTISVEERGYYYFLEFLIRKGAHILTFGALAIAAFIMTKRYLFSFILTIGLAAIDEFHQSLTGGRTPTIQDVYLDTFGAFLALLFIFIINKIRTKPKPI
jgi:VanZ family protein